MNRNHPVEELKERDNLGKTKTLVLAMGNPILGDDGVGIAVAHKIKEITDEPVVIEVFEAGLALLDYIEGYDKLILIDSIKTGQGKPGELYKINAESFKPDMYFLPSHGMDIATAFEIGRGVGHNIPQDISIYAIEIKDNSTFAEECTEEIKRKIPSIAKQIIEEEKI